MTAPLSAVFLPIFDGIFILFSMRILFVWCIAFSTTVTNSQQLYFPPVGTDEWETTDPAELGWCEEEIEPLLDYLENTNTKAFLVLKDGKIVIEEYFGDFTSNDVWYWASAGKSLTAFLTGMAQQQGFLDIEEPSLNYLGEGWSSLTPEQEQAITIRHHLTMTTGLDDGVDNLDCTDPECLTYLAEPGMRWSYHNAPYTLLDGVISGATGQTLNAYLFNTLSQSTGINAAYIPVDYNHVCYSRPRVMARFGILMLDHGHWNGNAIMTDEEYFNAMITASQPLNEAYGYLWWLNDAPTFMIPQTQWVFTGPPMADAPQEMYSAIGKNGQILNIVPSQNLLVVRMGDAPDGNAYLVPTIYNNEIWQYLNPVICGSSAVEETDRRPTVYPNPANDVLNISMAGFPEPVRYSFVDLSGRIVETGNLNSPSLPVEHLANGHYILQLLSGEKNTHITIHIQH